MNNDERIWLNNHLFQSLDEKYGTGGTIDVNASLSTTDSVNFSPLRLTISITNGEYNKKICWLSFAKLNELINCIDEVMKEENLKKIYDGNDPVEVERKYSKKLFRLLFKKSKDLNDCVLIGIYSNESDRNVTILTIDVFRAFVDILKQFKNNYFIVENMIINRYMRGIELNEIKSMNNNLKIIPKVFEELQEKIESLTSLNKIENTYDDSYNQQEPYDHINEDKEEDNNGEVFEAEANMEEFDKFIGDDFKNINLPDIENIEIENKQENVETIKSDLIEKVLDNDINNLYIKTKNIILEDCKIKTFNNLLNEEIGINPLEKINDKNLKSCIYLSELNIRQFLKQYYLYGIEYPKTCQMLRSDVNEVDTSNKELAYDLFMIHGYIKYYSNKMESRINDQLASKIDFYVNLRLFTDVFTYTFLINEKTDMVKHNVINRFKYFKQKGFFSSFDKELEDYNLSEVTVDEISNFVDLVLQKLPNTTEIIKLHDELYNNKNVKLPSDNKFNIEQIINQFINLEILSNFNLTIEEGNCSKFDIDLEKINKDILKIFTENKKINKPKEKTTNLYRYIKYFDDEIPSDDKDKFYEFINNLDYNNFDFRSSGFNLNEFGENIIKGLYQWNLSDNKREKYTDFFFKCNETILNKNDILNKELSNEELEDDDSSDDWGVAFN